MAVAKPWKKHTGAPHLLLLLLVLATLADVCAVADPIDPITCQPASAHPALPIFHIIGNVTLLQPDNRTNIRVAPINDVSAVVKHLGVYHIFHQCCQNHWDHVVSTDLVHWQRLPSPLRPNLTDPVEWYDSKGSWDGSLALLPDSLGGPVIVYDVVEGKPPNASSPSSPSARSLQSGDPPTMAVAHAVNSSDPFLLAWRKDVPNPIDFGAGPGCSFPSGVWHNDALGRYNLLSQGWRYSTTDKTLHTWTRAPNRMMPYSERGGQWFMELPPTTDGSVPPADGPTHIVSDGGGTGFAFGRYNASNESWSTTGRPYPSKSSTDNGPDANWMTLQYAGDRVMNIGWAMGSHPMPSFPNDGGYLTLLREVHYDPVAMMLVANPPSELAALRNGTLSNASAVTIAPNATHLLGGTGGGSAAAADVVVSFAVEAGQPSDFGVCVLSALNRSSGIAIVVDLEPAKPSNGSPGGFKATVVVAPCSDPTRQQHGWGAGVFSLLPNQTEVDVRIVVDRSIVEAFVMGGKVVLTKTWAGAVDSNVQLFSGSGATAVTAEVWSMGCGWDPVPYTDIPTL